VRGREVRGTLEEGLEQQVVWDAGKIYLISKFCSTSAPTDSSEKPTRDLIQVCALKSRRHLGAWSPAVRENM